MLVQWNAHFLCLTGRTRCIRNAPALTHGLYSIRFPQLARQTSDFLIICRIFYKQTFIKAGRNGCFIEQAPLSSCFYEYLFRDICDDRMENVQTGWDSRKKGNCVSHASRQERSEKHLFWMLGERKWEFLWTSIFFPRYIHSNLWGRAGRHGDAVPLFSASALHLTFFVRIITWSLEQTRISIAKPEQTGKANLTE